MADEIITKVTYDTDPAIDEITKLDNKLKTAADNAQQSFGKMEQGSRLFEQGLNRVGGPANDLVGTLRGLATEYGTVGLTAGAVALSLTAVVSELVNIPELTKDAAAETLALNEALESELKLLNRLDDLSSARQFRKFTEDERQFDQRRVDLADEQNTIDEQRQDLQEKLGVYKEYYDSIDRRAEESVRSREGLEKKLTRILESAEASSVANLPIGRQVLELINLSQRAGSSGDIEKAERLLDKAKQAASQTGDQSGFFNRQISSAESGLVSQIEKQINARRREEEAIKAQRKAAEDLIKTAQAEDGALKGRQREIRRERRQVQIDSRESNLAKQIALDEDKADDAARSRAAAHQQILNLLSTERSLLQQITDIGKTAGSVFGGVGATRLTEQIQQVKQAQDLFVEASSKLSNRNTQDDEAGGQQLVKVQQLLGQIQALRAGGQLSGALEFNVQNLEQAVDAFNKIIEADTALEKTGKSQFDKKDEGGLLRGADDASNKLSSAKEEAQQLASFLSQAAESASRINPKIPSVPANSAPAIAAAQPAASPTATAVTQTINVNAEVKGGIIDAETTRTIVQLIQREIRAGTV